METNNTTEKNKHKGPQTNPKKSQQDERTGAATQRSSDQKYDADEKRQASNRRNSADQQDKNRKVKEEDQDQSDAEKSNRS
jgi:hypothetical protein